MTHAADASVPATDVRLCLAAVVGWLAVAIELSWPPARVGLVAFAGIAVACLAVRFGRRRAVAYAVGLCAAVVGLLSAPLAARLQTVRHGELAELATARQSVTLELVLLGDPHPLSAKGAGGAARIAVTASARAISVRGTDHRLSGVVLVLGSADAWQGLLPGQRVRVDGRLSSASADPLTAAILETRTAPSLLGRPPPSQRVAGAVRAGLRRACSGLPPLVRGLLPGVVDGDTSGLDPVLKERFRAAGLTHLVAVSGTNLSISIGALSLVVRRCRASPRMLAAVGVAAVIAFVIVARPSASVLRAAAMGVITMLGVATGRPRSALPLLGAAVVCLLCWHPELARDLGFTLSVVATGALIVVAPSWAAALERRGVPVGLSEAVAVAAAAHMLTAPIVVGFSGRFSLVAIPANLLAEPVVAVTTVLGLLAAVVSPVCASLAAGLAQCAAVPCRWLVAVAEYFGSLDGGSLPWPSGWLGAASLTVVSVACWGAVSVARGRRLLAVGGMVALIVQLPVRGAVTAWPPGHWLMVACDIGQGDAIVLSTRSAGGGTRAVVIDAGPDPVLVDRCLTDLGVREVAMLVITHDHLDHVGGIEGVGHERRVSGLLVSPLAQPSAGARLIRTAADRFGVNPITAVAGGEYSVGELALAILGPLRIARGSRSDPNNSSVVLMAVLGQRRLLLPGDAEVEEQDDLLASGTDLRADVLKVPHHGSAWSDPAFLGAVHASVAVVSVGAHNDYGHPSPLLLAEVARLGVPLLRTDHDGDIAIVRDADRLRPVVHAVSVAAGGLAPPVPPTHGPHSAVQADCCSQPGPAQRECLLPAADAMPSCNRASEVGCVGTRRDKEPLGRGPPAEAAAEQQRADQRIAIPHGTQQNAGCRVRRCIARERLVGLFGCCQERDARREAGGTRANGNEVDGAQARHGDSSVLGGSGGVVRFCSTGPSEPRATMALCRPHQHLQASRR